MKSIRYVIATMLLAAATVVGATATASAAPYWQSYAKTNRFHCDEQVTWSPGVYSETCVVINGTATQAVVIVDNYSGSAVNIEALNVRLWHNGTIASDVDCLASTLNTGNGRACFGPTKQFPCNHAVQAFSWINIGLGSDQRLTDTFRMCVT
jgi:hypothetical protein